MDLFLIPERFRRWIPLILSIISGGIGGILGWMIIPSFPILASAFGFTFGFLYMMLFVSLLVYFFSSRAEAINSQFNHLNKQIYETKRELRSMVNIRPLLRRNLVPFGDWAIDGQFGETLIGLVQEKRPKLAIECGSGTSTVLIACLLKRMECGKIVALEHLEKYASVNRKRLENGNLDSVATIIETPLREWILNENKQLWYDFEPAAHLKRSIDMLIVDGPPGNTGPLARYPAVPILREWISPGGVIVLDDTNRDDEQEIAKQWINELNATAEFHPEGKGICIMQLPKR